MSLFIKHYKYTSTSWEQVEINNKQHNTLLRETRTTSEEIQNRIQNKLCYNSESNLNPRLSIYDSQTNWQRQKSSVFCNAKYISIIREKQRLTGETWIMPPPPPTVITHICKIRPLQRIRKPSSKFRRKRPVILQISLILKLATSKANWSTNGLV